jgi:hypothetical protein
VCSDSRSASGGFCVRITIKRSPLSYSQEAKSSSQRGLISPLSSLTVVRKREKSAPNKHKEFTELVHKGPHEFTRNTAAKDSESDRKKVRLQYGWGLGLVDRE